MTDEKRETEPPLHLDLPFDEALARLAQTNPDEVEPPNGRKRKRPKISMMKPRLVPMETHLGKLRPARGARV